MFTDKVNRITNKLFKYWFVLILAIVGIAFLRSGETPQEVSAAQSEIWNAYKGTGVYSKLACRSGQVGANWLVLCETGGNNGLYEVDIQSEGRFVIYAVNGTAKTHAEKMGKPYHFNRDSSVDIGQALKELG